MNDECIKCNNYLECIKNQDTVEHGCPTDMHFEQASAEQIKENSRPEYPFPDPVYRAGYDYACGYRD